VLFAVLTNVLFAALFAVLTVVSIAVLIAVLAVVPIAVLFAALFAADRCVVCCADCCAGCYADRCAFLLCWLLCRSLCCLPRCLLCWLLCRSLNFVGCAVCCADCADRCVSQYLFQFSSFSNRYSLGENKSKEEIASLLTTYGNGTVASFDAYMLTRASDPAFHAISHTRAGKNTTQKFSCYLPYSLEMWTLHCFRMLNSGVSWPS
jgi:hypothetical protein